MDGMNARVSRDARAMRGNEALDPSLKIQVPANIRSERSQLHGGHVGLQ